jgi:hypothetical protein
MKHVIYHFYCVVIVNSMLLKFISPFWVFYNLLRNFEVSVILIILQGKKKS